MHYKFLWSNICIQKYSYLVSFKPHLSSRSLLKSWTICLKARSTEEVSAEISCTNNYLKSALKINRPPKTGGFLKRLFRIKLTSQQPRLSILIPVLNTPLGTANQTVQLHSKSSSPKKKILSKGKWLNALNEINAGICFDVKF